MNTTKYYIAAFSTYLIWGFFSFALKPLSDYPAVDLLFYRVFYSAIILGVVHLTLRRKETLENIERFKRKSKEEKISLYKQVLAGSVFMISNWLFFIYIMNSISLKAGSLAYLICPIITSILAFFILKEALGKWQKVAILISVVACTLLAMNHLVDLLYSVIVAISFALYLISQKKNTGIDKLLMLLLHVTCASIILLPFYPFYASPFPTESKFHIYMLIIAVIFTIVPLFLNLYSLKGISSSAVGIMIYINPIMNFLLAVFYYHEPVSVIQLISYGLIVVCIILFNLENFVKLRSATLTKV